MAGFLFGGDTNETAESLARKRAIAKSLMEQAGSTAPASLGEGIERLGSGIMAALFNAKDKAADQQFGKEFASKVGGMFDGATTPQKPSVAQMLTAPAASRETASAPAVTGGAGTDALPGGTGKDALASVASGAGGLTHDQADKTATAMLKSPWSLASGQIGNGEYAHKAALMDYLKTGGVNIDPTTRAWCADFVNATLSQAGVKGTGSSAARSFLNWGSPTNTPHRGDVVVLSRGSDPTKGHVGFFDSMSPDGQSISLLSGNHSDAVGMGNYPVSRILGYRTMPNGAPTVQPAADTPATAQPPMGMSFNGPASIAPPVQQPTPQPQVIPAATPPMQQPVQQPLTNFQRTNLTAANRDGGVTDPRNRAMLQQSGVRGAMLGPSQDTSNPQVQAAVGKQAADVAGMSQQQMMQGAVQQVSGMPMSQILELASNPRLNEAQGAILQFVIKQKLDSGEWKESGGVLFNSKTGETRHINSASQTLDDQYKQAQIAKLKADTKDALNPDSRKKLGLNPIYGMKDGKQIILQPSENGGLVEAGMPDGVTLTPGVDKIDLGDSWGITDRSGQVVQRIPKNLKKAASDKAQGDIEGNALAELGPSMVEARSTLQQIDQVLKDPNLDKAVGPIDGRMPDAMMSVWNPGAYAVRQRFSQLRGKAFLSAYSVLKGGGAITNVEGDKATDALARMDTAQSEGDFRQALGDFRDALQTGIDKLAARANVQAPQVDQQDLQSSPEFTPDQIRRTRDVYSLSSDEAAIAKLRQKSAGRPVIRDKAAYDALPSGAEYQAPDGSIRRKN